MSYTKRTIINQAHAEIGLGSYAYDLQPEDLQDALLRLNALLAQWSGNGAQVGWPSVNSELVDDLDADSGLPVDAVRGVICALAVDIAPGFGKAPSRETKIAARQGKKLMTRKSMTIPQREMDATSIPAGAGWKWDQRISLSESDSDIKEGEVTRD